MTLTNQRGFSLIELLVGLVLAGLIGTAIATVMLQNSRLNRSQQLLANAQNNARASMDLVVGRLRSAGWDPMAAGIGTSSPPIRISATRSARSRSSPTSTRTARPQPPGSRR